MTTEKYQLAGVAGRLDGMYKFLEEHPEELGVNNKIFRESLAECSKIVCDILGIESDIKDNVNAK